MAQHIKIATRKSPLALWQANHVAGQLKSYYSDLRVELVPIETEGDRFLNQSLSQAGGKGLFIKALEDALLGRHCHLAVHSMKDLPVELFPPFVVPAVLARVDRRDVLLSVQYASLAELPAQAKVGTSSPRRIAQLKALRPDIQCVALRGNIGTRVAKLDSGQYDAIILAAAGVIRLGLEDRIVEYFAPDWFMPAIGQGVIGIECCAEDTQIIGLLEALNHAPTWQCIEVERAFNGYLNGGCQRPIAAYADLDGTIIKLSGLVASIDGRQLIRGSLTGDVAEADHLGCTLARQLLADGAAQILSEHVEKL